MFAARASAISCSMRSCSARSAASASARSRAARSRSSRSTRSRSSCSARSASASALSAAASASSAAPSPSAAAASASGAVPSSSAAAASVSGAAPSSSAAASASGAAPSSPAKSSPYDAASSSSGSGSGEGVRGGVFALADDGVGSGVGDRAGFLAAGASSKVKAFAKVSLPALRWWSTNSSKVGTTSSWSGDGRWSEAQVHGAAVASSAHRPPSASASAAEGTPARFTKSATALRIREADGKVLNCSFEKSTPTFGGTSSKKRTATCTSNAPKPGSPFRLSSLVLAPGTSLTRDPQRTPQSLNASRAARAALSASTRYFAGSCFVVICSPLFGAASTLTKQSQAPRASYSAHGRGAGVGKSENLGFGGSWGRASRNKPPSMRRTYRVVSSSARHLASFVS